MDVTLLKTDSCTSLYDVGGTHVHLQIIIGGTPLLMLVDFTFQERFPIKDTRWDVSHNVWAKRNCYPHQDPSNLVGPTFDVLPEGKKTLIEYAERAGKLKTLRDNRFAILSEGIQTDYSAIVSKRVHDRQNRAYLFFKASFTSWRFGPVTIDSANTGGRCNDLIEQFAPQWWKDYAAFVNPIFDSHRTSYEKLTEDEFIQMNLLLKRSPLYNKKG